ncbi:MAG: hypothetical protein ACRDL8_08635 [Solirubrobacteraceae bacterium]
MSELPPPSDPDDDVARPWLDHDHVLEPVSSEDVYTASDPTPLVRDANGRLWRPRPASVSAWLSSQTDGLRRGLYRLFGGS